MHTTLNSRAQIHIMVCYALNHVLAAPRDTHTCAFISDIRHCNIQHKRQKDRDYTRLLIVNVIYSSISSYDAQIPPRKYNKRVSPCCCDDIQTIAMLLSYYTSRQRMTDILHLVDHTLVLTRFFGTQYRSRCKMTSPLANSLLSQFGTSAS